MTPMILIPGAMATASSWTYQLLEFSRDRTVVVPDAHFGLPTLNQMATAIAEGLPDECDVVGWSMGGYIAFELYRLVAARIRKLVLASTTARPENAETRRARLVAMDVAETQGLGALWDQTFCSAVADPQLVDQEIVTRVRADYLSLGMSTLRTQCQAMIGRRDARTLLGTIRCATMVVAGGDDSVIPPELALEMASQLPRGRLEVIAGAGHCLPYEVPKRLNALLRDFLE